MKKNALTFTLLFCFFCCSLYYQMHAMDENYETFKVESLTFSNGTSVHPYEDKESWCTKKQKVMYACCAALIAFCGVGGCCVCLTTGTSIGFNYLFKYVNITTAHNIIAILQKHNITWKQFLKMLQTVIAYKT